MNTRLMLSLVVIVVLLTSVGGATAHIGAPAPAAPSATAIGSGFTFQGQLENANAAVNGNCDMAFRLYDDAAAGTQIGSAITTTVPVSNSLFTVMLNTGGEFGANAFDGTARWLEMAMRCPAGSGGYTALAPRQAITAVPYAISAGTAMTATTVTGMVAEPRIDPLIARKSEIVPTVTAAGFITKTLADAIYAATSHVHSGADITSGTVAEPHIDPLIARDSEIVPAVAAAGFITKTLADAAYARISPTTQQIAMLKWYTAISTTQSNFASGGAEPVGIAFDGANMWVANQNSYTVGVLRVSDGSLVATYSGFSVPGFLAYDGVNMWIPNGAANTVSVLRAKDGFRVMTPTVGSGPTEIAFDGVNMWVTNANANTVSVIRASDGFHVMTQTVGVNPINIAFDGTNM